MDAYEKNGSVLKIDREVPKTKQRTIGEILMYSRSKRQTRQRRADQLPNKTMKLGWQQMIIWRMFKDIEGPVPSSLRKKAVALTGLSWKQIYKWIFDRILIARKGPDFYQSKRDDSNYTLATPPRVCD